MKSDPVGCLLAIFAPLAATVVTVVICGMLFMSCETSQKNEHKEKLACIDKVKSGDENPDRDLKMCMLDGYEEN